MDGPRLTATERLEILGEEILACAAVPADVYRTQYRLFIHHYIWQTYGGYDDARSWTLVDSFLDDLYARAVNELTPSESDFGELDFSILEATTSSASESDSVVNG
eukprot:GHVU01001608.1.p2 GENE.GHVU01001608.1~~GHVU01001608.1.p2  ORF type:complete len:105 (-),score=14.10 GHVU01001608.1:413-727(-)